VSSRTTSVQFHLCCLVPVCQLELACFVSSNNFCSPHLINSLSSSNLYTTVKSFSYQNHLRRTKNKVQFSQHHEAVSFSFTFLRLVCVADSLETITKTTIQFVFLKGNKTSSITTSPVFRGAQQC
jgi:hypothetical protein